MLSDLNYHTAYCCFGLFIFLQNNRKGQSHRCQRAVKFKIRNQVTGAPSHDQCCEKLEKTMRKSFQ